LTAEISNIYKRLDKVRKIHNVVFAPSFEAALKIQAKLETIGNIRSDGRPILGLDSRDLLEIVLHSDPLAFLIPAHIWTPWFAVLGSKGGFDSIDDCFADLTPHIFAVETGLSSDPTMNWRLKQLDRFVLVSNSDAHSPPKLAREANLFDAELSYPAMYRAWKDYDDKGFLGTIEFFPEEGKYHYDGHRACRMRLHPRETAEHEGNCPVCGKPVTVGVMARVEALADRPEGEKSPRWRPYTNLIPLPEVIAEAHGKKAGTKSVDQVFIRMLKQLGNELYILQDASIEDITKNAGPVVAEGIRRMRSGEVKIAAGYDGEYGTIHLFTPEERKDFLRQTSLVETELEATLDETESKNGGIARGAKQSQAGSREPEQSGVESTAQTFDSLNPSQRKAVVHEHGHLIIVAGPGTGKTHTLVHRAIHLVQSGERPESMLAITFTNKAAEEMRQRLHDRLQEMAVLIEVGTFHAFCLALLRRYGGDQADFEIINDAQKKEMVKELWPEVTTAERSAWVEEISYQKAVLSPPASEKHAAKRQRYDEALRRQRFWDFDDLLLQTIQLLENNAAIQLELHQRLAWIFVDEYQDLNPAQHRLLKLLVHANARLTAIGDPNQAIYGFRGSETAYFNRFTQDFPGAVMLRLEENYRSGANILSASGQVIAAGEQSAALPLLPASLLAGNVTIYAAPTEHAEAEYLVHQIEKLVGGTSMFSQDSGRVEHEREGKFSFGDFAILYRLNAMRGPLEEALQRSGMPYQISSETPLAQRDGVPELLALIRLAAGLHLEPRHLADYLMLATPGFGESTAKTAASFFATLPQLRVESIAQFIDRQNPQAKQREALQRTLAAIEIFKRDLNEHGLARALENFLASDHVRETVASKQKCWENWGRIVNLSRWHTTPRALLDALALQNEADQIEARAEKISVMTLHAAKGLEFPVVFVAGCEEGLTPMQLENLQGDLAEERRLFYVGMTRAKERLYLVRAARRMLFGKTRQHPASRFLADIEEQLKAYEHWQAKPKKNVDKIADQQLKLF
ncbi:UvrD-helicase domain-containing protein, partial [candidate division KSB1 bacterium]|nr:UvrD-helicase domain-containing protein [candidate division KSB1 bacterium]